VADKGYSARTFRAYLRKRGIKATIPERVDQLAGRRRRRERPCGFDPAVYRRRNVVERCFHRLKQWRGIATRYDKQSWPLPRRHPPGQHTHLARCVIDKTLPGGGASSIGPDRRAASGVVHRKAEEGVDAMGVPPARAQPSVGESATDDNAARRGARRREPGMIARHPYGAVTSPRRDPSSGVTDPATDRDERP